MPTWRIKPDEKHSKIYMTNSVSVVF